MNFFLTEWISIYRVRIQYSICGGKNEWAVAGNLVLVLVVCGRKVRGMKLGIKNNSTCLVK